MANKKRTIGKRTRLSSAVLCVQKAAVAKSKSLLD